MNFLLLLLTLAISIGLFILAVFVVMLNVNEILHNGTANFWNIFWILLFAGGVAGGVSRTVK